MDNINNTVMEQISGGFISLYSIDSVAEEGNTALYVHVSYLAELERCSATHDRYEDWSSNNVVKKP